MSLAHWLNFFKKYRDIQLFHFQHLKVLTEMESHTLRVALKRLNEKGFFQRVCRGFYANPLNPPGLEDVSGIIYAPSYISLESALSRRGILSQIPQILTCITTKLPRKFSTGFGAIEYHQLKKEYFWGFIQEGKHFIAEPEKALLDYLYFKRKKDQLQACSELDLNALNFRKLKSFAQKMRILLPFSPTHKYSLR